MQAVYDHDIFLQIAGTPTAAWLTDSDGGHLRKGRRVRIAGKLQCDPFLLVFRRADKPGLIPRVVNARQKRATRWSWSLAARATSLE